MFAPGRRSFFYIATKKEKKRRRATTSCPEKKKNDYLKGTVFPSNIVSQEDEDFLTCVLRDWGKIEAERENCT